MSTALARVALVLLAAASLVGGFLPGIYDGLVSPAQVPESQGRDLVSLFVAAPLLFVSLRGGRTRGFWARATTVGVLGYAAFVFVLYAYGGVVNRLFFVYVAGLGASVIGLGSLLLEPAEAEPPVPTRLAKATGLFLLGTALVLTVIWCNLGAIAIVRGRPLEANLVMVTELAFVLPAMVAVAVASLKRFDGAAFGSTAVLTLLTLLMGSVVAGQLARYGWGIEPMWALTALFASIGVGSAILLAQHPRRDEAEDDED